MGGYPPLRQVPSWDGLRTVYRCEVCGCGVRIDHAPGSDACWDLLRERQAKAAD